MRSISKKDVPAAELVDLAPGGHQFVAARETLESIVVAFALAFLIRTFEAEAFVIPTGSMSPALLGQHKDVCCAQCGYRYRTTASSEDPEEAARRGARNIRDQQILAGVCPMCRYVMPMRPDLPREALDAAGLKPAEIPATRTYPGDRILVNKFGSDFHDPQRWDVVVFKFPGDGNMNYIKRLVGLPGERLRVFQGDLFARPLADAAAPFAILRKPPQKVVPLLQPVHDTAFEPAILHAAGWPLRWAATTPAGWQVAAETSKGRQNVSQRFSADAAAGAETAWLRYRHMVPEAVDWRLALDFHKSGSWSDAEKKTGLTQAQWLEHSRPELIADFNPYNARIERELIEAGMSWDLFNERGRDFWTRLGANWVGDLAVECDLASAEPHGSLVLDLVEAGIHYRAAFDLAKDRVELAAIDGRTGQPLDFHAEAPAKIAGGAHQLRFANVDDQLLLWIDDTIVDFDDSTYDADKFFPAGRDGSVPWKGPQGEDQGDLSPIGVGAVGAKVAVTRLAVLRDTYYIATDHREVAKDGGRGWLDSKYDYASPYRPANNPAGGALPAVDPPRDLFAVAETWPRFLTRRKVEFDIQNGQLFVMGDNSPESKDARLWAAGDRLSGFPGGSYVDRRLLIGKAICVFWPHSWGAVPGIPQLPGWPNFRDMRFVK